MSPAEFELAQEQAEDAYRGGRIDEIEFRRRMDDLGFGRRSCDEFITSVAQERDALAAQPK